MLPLDEFYELGPAMEPLAYECMGYSEEELGRLVREVILEIEDHLQHAGFFERPEMLLIVPRVIDDLPIGLPVAATQFLDNIALLLTFSVGGYKIISTPDEMTLEQWLYAISQGKRPNLIITMPWAQARFLNWGAG
jgi:hypothetical protein